MGAIAMKRVSAIGVSAIAAVAALLIVGCSKSGTSAASGKRINAWTHPHVLTFTDAADVDSLNPMLTGTHRIISVIDDGGILDEMGSSQ
jgi:hypothetical protein